MRVADYWHREDDGRVQCDLCPHACRLTDGATGRCHVRSADNGRLVAAAYGRLSSLAVDPIEKKPLYHFLPGTQILSLGGWGCNLRCEFCQNWTLSQTGPRHDQGLSAEGVIERARAEGTPSIAYTYNEPLIAIEYVLDCARRARERGLKNVLVTNGYVNPAPASDLLPFVDAVNLDIKSMSPSFYRRLCGGDVEPVLAFARQAREAGCHVEITNLVIPGQNDTDADVVSLAGWVADTLGKDTVLHLSAYHPQYRMESPPTPAQRLLDVRMLARGYLRYVYVGNVRTASGRDTACPACGAVLVRRSGMCGTVTGISRGCCTSCGARAEIVMT